jgi:hypothetical protein
MSIVLVFMFAFGVSTQALLYPNQNLTSTVLGNVFLPSYFILSGDNYALRKTIMYAVDANLLSIQYKTD